MINKMLYIIESLGYETNCIQICYFFYQPMKIWKCIQMSTMVEDGEDLFSWYLLHGDGKQNGNNMKNV